jgi:ribosomal protein S27AE
MTERFPPPGYIPIESAVEGIEVYKIIPKDSESLKEVVDFDCPRCGATTAFSIHNSGLTCAHCGYYEAPEKETVGKGAQEFEFTVKTLERSAQGWGDVRNAIDCQNCGAQISVPIESLSHTCVFCGSNKVIQRQASQDSLRPRFLIPFKIEVFQCKEITHEWLGSGWMLPSKLKEISGNVEFRGIYLPFWTFDSRTYADWKAEVGHEKTERYFKDGEWKTRTVIEWCWESGNVEKFFDDLVINGTDRLSELHFEKINNFDLNALSEYESKFLAGMQAKSYDISLEGAWEKSRHKMREITRLVCRKQASTPRIRNFSMSLDFREESWRYILLPIYLAAYQYMGKSFQVMINGQNGSISGQRPVDWTKVWLVIAAILSPGLLLGIIGLITIPFLGIGAVIGILGFILFVIGIVFGFMIFQKANEMDVI